jgi:hypothetical protein
MNDYRAIWGKWVPVKGAQWRKSIKYCGICARIETQISNKWLSLLALTLAFGGVGKTGSMNRCNQPEKGSPIYSDLM